MARYSPTAGGGAPIAIIDKWPGEPPTRFLTDNLGSYLTSQNTNIFPNDARAAASLLTVVSPEAFENRRLGIPRDLLRVPSELAALSEFATRKAISMSLASIAFAPKLEPWSESFNLVVGNGFADRVTFWNARLLVPSWLDPELCCLRVDKDQLADAEFLSVLGELLKRRNHVSRNGGGQPQLTIRSCSETPESFEADVVAVKSTKPWGPVSCELVPSLEAIVPSVDALSLARENYQIGGGLFGAANWKEFPWTPPLARPPPILPDHISDAPPRQAFNEGYWSTDYLFEYDGPSSRFLIRNRWELPRRWRMAGAFKVAFAEQRSLAAIPPRTRRGRTGTLVIAELAISCYEYRSSYGRNGNQIFACGGRLMGAARRGAGSD